MVDSLEIFYPGGSFKLELSNGRRATLQNGEPCWMKELASGDGLVPIPCIRQTSIGTGNSTLLKVPMIGNYVFP